MKYSIFSLFTLLGISLFAQIPAGYYDSANGLTGYALKTELKNIIDNHTAVPYSNINDYFDDTDTDLFYENDGTVLDIYSENPAGADPYNFNFTMADQCGNYNGEGDCYNPEHVFPQGFYNQLLPMRSDLHQLIPTDGYINNGRGNLPFGETNSGTTYQNGTQRGTSATPGFNGTVFEPIDEFKGDVARMLLYFATRYESEINGAGWDAHDADINNPLNGTSDQVYEDWFINLLLQWHANDAVSARETARNNAIYAIQGNRNPFIDHPEYVAEIWQPIPDTTIPSTPSNLMISNITSSTMNLTWNASNDDYGVSEYIITMDGNQTFTSSSTSYTVMGLQPETQYCFTVKAVDTSGNESTESTSECATTAAGSSGQNLLLFTEYVEGSSFNKALEIGNFTGSTVDLAEYVIKKQANGSGAWGGDYALSGMLNDGEVVVISHASAAADILAVADFTIGSSPLDFNGNDPVGLFHNGDLVDIIGEFNSSADFGANITLRRLPAITQPNVTYTLGEWESFASGTHDGLGMHTLGVLDTELATLKIQLYPNPATDYFSIEGIAAQDAAKVQIFNVQGKLVAEVADYSNQKIKVGHLESGMYFVLVRTENASKTIKLMVK